MQFSTLHQRYAMLAVAADRAAHALQEAARHAELPLWLRTYMRQEATALMAAADEATRTSQCPT